MPSVTYKPLSRASENSHAAQPDASNATACDRKWYAVFTVPQNEQSAVKHLALRDVESFCPTYETVRLWKNRQKKKLVLPLFPSYLFVRIHDKQRCAVLKSPGVLQIVGRRNEYSPLPIAEIDFLRSSASKKMMEPYGELVLGEKVRVKSGIVQGLQGTLVRKGNSMRFILSLDLINQHAAIQVDAEDLEPISA